jgi:hypothetical protein
MATNSSQLERNIRSVGVSILVLGGFYAFMTAFTVFLWTASVVAEDDLTVIGSVVVSAVITLFWIAMGLAVRRNAGNPVQALKLITIVMYVAIAFLALSIVETLTYGVSSGVIISAIFASYMIWSYIDVKDRIAGKKRS